MSNFTLSSDSGLVVFTGSGCSSCNRLKDQLSNKNIQFTEYNVHDNEDAAEFLRKQGLRTLPVVFSNGKRAQLNG